MKRRSGWILASLLGVGLLFAAAGAVGAESDEAAGSGGESVAELEQTASDAGDRTRGNVKAEEKRRGSNRKAGAREREAERRKARAEKKAAKREVKKAKKRGKGEKARKDGAARELPGQDSRTRRGKGEPPEQAKGFWNRWFGSGADDEE